MVWGCWACVCKTISNFILKLRLLYVFFTLICHHVWNPTLSLLLPLLYWIWCSAAWGRKWIIMLTFSIVNCLSVWHQFENRTKAVQNQSLHVTNLSSEFLRIFLPPQQPRSVYFLVRLSVQSFKLLIRITEDIYICRHLKLYTTYSFTGLM